MGKKKIALCSGQGNEGGAFDSRRNKNNRQGVVAMEIEEKGNEGIDGGREKTVRQLGNNLRSQKLLLYNAKACHLSLSRGLYSNVGSTVWQYLVPRGGRGRYQNNWCQQCAGSLMDAFDFHTLMSLFK